MHLSYNGIDLKVVRVLECSRTAEYDPTGQDYLWTRWRVAVEAVYSPQEVESYTGSKQNQYVTAGSVAPIPFGGTAPAGGSNQPPDPIAPVMGQVRSAPMTDVALRHRLMQPRGALKLDFASMFGTDPNAPDFPPGSSGNPIEVWLESPGRDVTGLPKPCDAANGPIPQECTPTILGNGRTFLVRYAIETCVSDCRPSLAGNAAVLSNRWTASVSYDDAYFATRTLTGLVILRPDILHARNLFPDDLRIDLLPPVPVNCKRFVDELTPLPDGISYQYVVRDVEEEYTYFDTPISPGGSAFQGAKPRHIASIQATVNRRFGQSGAKTALSETMSALSQVAFAMQTMEQFVGGSGMAGDMAGRMSGMTKKYAGMLGGKGISGKGAGPVTAVLKFMELGAKGSAAFVSAADSVLPTYEEVVTVEVRGTRLATRARLQATALAVAFGQLTNVVGETRGPVDGITLGIGGSVGLGAVVGATTQLIMNAAGMNVPEPSHFIRSVIPPASVYELEYDLHARRLRVTVSQTYSGLVDWLTARTAGGWKAITAPLQETASGAAWPLSAIYNQNVGAASPTEVLPHLPDFGLPVLASADGPGIAPPVQDGRMGTNLTEIVAAGLLGECAKPPAFDWDLPGEVPNNTSINGPWRYPTITSSGAPGV